ncbi:MAG TPA: hypothetical protein VJ247_08275, partial [Gaiella sp.]|nr:hypothetical protein [Gaiella sp.]
SRPGRAGRGALARRTRLIPSRSMGDQYVLEHRERRLTRRVRQNRLRIALAIAAAEAILVIVGVMPWWLVVLLALGAVTAYAAWGREHANADVRVLTWTAAVSQLLVVLVPVLAGALVVLAAVAVVLLAGVVLAAILLDRR